MLNQSALGEAPPFDEQPDVQGPRGFPTFEAVVNEAMVDFKNVIQACTSEADAKRLKPLLCILEKKDLIELIEGPLYTGNLRNQITNMNVSGKTTSQRMEELLKKAIRTKLEKLFDDVSNEPGTKDAIFSIICDISNASDLTAINKIFECDRITDGVKKTLWSRIMEDKQFIRMLQGWELKDQCTEQIRATLQLYIDQEDKDEVITNLTQAIINNRCANPTIVNDKKISTNGDRKERLANAISKLASFKKYIANGGKDPICLEAKMKIWLLNLLSTKIPISISETKLSIVKKLTENPHFRVSDFETLSKDQQGKLKDALKNSIQFHEFKQSQRSQLTIAEKKVKAIDDIVGDRQVTDRDRPEIRRLLEQGNMDELFKNSVVWRQHIEYFDLIHNKKETTAYKTAIEQNNQDIDEIENKLKESVENILEQEGVSSALIGKVSEGLLSGKGDLKVIEGDNNFSRNQQTSLPEQIESLKEYKLLKKLKWQPVDLEKITSFEILNALVHANTAKRDFADMVDLTKRIISGKTLDEVLGNGNLTATDKITIIDILSNAEKCPNLTQYLRYYGCHKETNEYQLKEALVPVQRQLKIDFTVFRALQESFLREQSFEAARSSDQLTELQRESLLKFLLTNEACCKFLQACKIYKAVEQIDSLRAEVERQLVRATKLGRKGAGRYGAVIHSAIIDFCKIDESIAGKTYDDTEVGEVIGDEALMSAYQEIEASEPYQEFMGSYGFLVTTRLKMSEESLKRYFMSLIDLNRQNREHGEELFKDWSTTLKFQRGSLAAYKESEIGAGVIRRIAGEIQKSEQYESFMKSTDALNLRKQLIGSSLFGSTVEDLKYQKELWKLDRESLSEVLDGLKHFNVDTLQNSTQLSPDQKKEVAGKLIRSEGFEKYWDAKDQLQQSDFDTLEHFKASLEEISKEVMKEKPVSPVKERPAEDKQEVSPPRITKKSEPAVTTKPSLTTTAKPAEQKKAGKAPPPPPPKDEDFLKSKPNYSGQLFTEMGITVEQFKNNTTPEFRKTYAERFTAEIVKLVDKMWAEASTPGNETQLGLFIANENPGLPVIKETIASGSTDFKCEMRPKPKEKLVKQLNESADFKRIVELNANKTSLQS